MELIYFISGILTVGTVYGVLLLRKVKSSYDEVLEESSRLYSLTQITQDEIAGKFDSVREQLIEVLDNNEKRKGEKHAILAFRLQAAINYRRTEGWGMGCGAWGLMPNENIYGSTQHKGKKHKAQTHKRTHRTNIDTQHSTPRDSTTRHNMNKSLSHRPRTADCALRLCGKPSVVCSDRTIG